MDIHICCRKFIQKQPLALARVRGRERTQPWGTRSGSRHVGASLHHSLGPSLSLSDPFARRIMIRRIDVFSELYREDPGTSSISASGACVLAPLPAPAP